MAVEPRLAIEIVYAAREQQEVVALSVPPGTTVDQAIALSGLRERRGAPAAGQVGIYGKLVRGDTVLRDGDRIEIYRSLVADPKQARRRRASPAR